MRRWNPNQYKQRNHAVCNSLRMLMMTYTRGTPKTTARVMHTQVGEKSNKCNKCDFVSSQAIHPLGLTVYDGEKLNVQTMWLYSKHPLGLTVWGHISKHTLEKSQTNARSVSSYQHYPSFPQIVCIKVYIITFTAFLECVYSDVSSNLWWIVLSYKWPALKNTNSHQLHLSDLSPMCIFKCVLKTPG